MHSLDFHKRAQKALQSIPPDRAKQIIGAVRELVYLDNPRTHLNVRAMEGEWEGSMRMRIGSYRVIFEVIEEINMTFIIRVTHIGPRGGIYG
jgi:mRNA interferase RelE/StbE